MNALKINFYTYCNGSCPESSIHGLHADLRLNVNDSYESTRTGLQILYAFPYAVILKTRGLRQYKSHSDSSINPLDGCLLVPQTKREYPYHDGTLFQSEDELIYYIENIVSPCIPILASTKSILPRSLQIEETIDGDKVHRHILQNASFTIPSYVLNIIGRALSDTWNQFKGNVNNQLLTAAVTQGLQRNKIVIGEYRVQQIMRLTFDALEKYYSIKVI